MLNNTRITLALTAALSAGAASVAVDSRVQAPSAARVDEIFKEFTAPGSPGCTAGSLRRLWRATTGCPGTRASGVPG